VSRVEVAVRASAVALIVCLAAVLALAGHDVLAWRGQTKRADIAVVRFSHDLGVWEPRTVLPTGVSRWLLGTGDDVHFGQALQRLQLLRGRRPSSQFDPPRVELARLELAFDDLAQHSARAAVRSRAQELHALVLLQQLLLQSGSFGSAADQAFLQTITALQESVRTDPTNAEAEYDLETILDLYRPIAIEEASQLSLRHAKRGDTGGGGGSAGTGAAGAGGF
jgi:hypothetical protein